MFSRSFSFDCAASSAAKPAQTSLYKRWRSSSTGDAGLRWDMLHETVQLRITWRGSSITIWFVEINDEDDRDALAACEALVVVVRYRECCQCWYDQAKHQFTIPASAVPKLISSKRKSGISRQEKSLSVPGQATSNRSSLPSRLGGARVSAQNRSFIRFIIQIHGSFYFTSTRVHVSVRNQKDERLNCTQGYQQAFQQNGDTSE